MEAAEEVNMIFFGDGLPTYERISDPLESLVYFEAKEPDGNGGEVTVGYYYYEVPDSSYDRVIAYRKKGESTSKYTYATVVDKPIEGKTPVYEKPESAIYAYILEDYVEPEYEFFYNEDYPEDYDVVREDCGYELVSDIKAAAEKVYSADLLSGIYSTMFVSSSMPARYMNYTDSEGNIRLLKSNRYEPLIKETRKFDFSTAEVVKPSDSEYVNVEIESYLPSDPSNRITVRISLTMQNGVWMLDSPTC